MPRANPETLPKRADFLRAAARGRKVARPGFVVQVLKTTPDATLRIGFTASRKVGNAVHRNRARRRLRAAVRLELGTRALAGADIVVIARKDTAKVDFARMRADLGAILDQSFAPLAGPPADGPV
ncbi:MAG: ribonuclease P protein component [Acidiphilium sp.]|nr:ribonuclease P protein component [Acidiphilium sp.]MDD4936661.1 ribonuclease P protein component [Acidiphilium sp.]